MNNKLIAVLVAASLGSAAAWAENLDNPAWPEAPGVPVSSAQVQADLAQYQQQLRRHAARAEDKAEPAAAHLDAAAAPARAQVRAEAIQARLQHAHYGAGPVEMPF